MTFDAFLIALFIIFVLSRGTGEDNPLFTRSCGYLLRVFVYGFTNSLKNSRSNQVSMGKVTVLDPKQMGT